MTKKIVAIHQPNFFPWLGYFDKLTKADIFIILDDVQFPKKGGTYINRVQIMMSGRGNWITLPIVRKYHGVKKISEIEINNIMRWKDIIIKTINVNYSRALFYKECMALIEDIFDYESNKVIDFNLNALNILTKWIGIDESKIILSSSLNIDDTGTDRLISLIHKVSGKCYLCGGGASGYQQDDKFERAGIELIYQNYQHPVYLQPRQDQFIPGLSIIDALMNCGNEGVRKMLHA